MQDKLARLRSEEVRRGLAVVLGDVEHGLDVVVTRHGREVAVMISYARYQALCGGERQGPNVEELRPGFLGERTELVAKVTVPSPEPPKRPELTWRQRFVTLGPRPAGFGEVFFAWQKAILEEIERAKMASNTEALQAFEKLLES